MQFESCLGLVPIPCPRQCPGFGQKTHRVRNQTCITASFHLVSPLPPSVPRRCLWPEIIKPVIWCTALYVLHLHSLRRRLFARHGHLHWPVSCFCCPRNFLPSAGFRVIGRFDFRYASIARRTIAATGASVSACNLSSANRCSSVT